MKQDIHTVDYRRLADAVHESVCAMTGDDGSTWCLTYAILGADWLNRWTGVPHALVGGKLAALLGDEDRTTALFEHFWIMRGVPGAWTHIDLATRHNATLVGKGLPSVDTSRFAVPFYVGDGSDIADRWIYYVQNEPSQFAQSQRHMRDRDSVFRIARRMASAV